MYYSCIVSLLSITICTSASIYFLLVSTLHSVSGTCTLCQPVLIVSTSEKKYTFVSLLRYVLTKQV